MRNISDQLSAFGFQQEQGRSRKGKSKGRARALAARGWLLVAPCLRLAACGFLLAACCCFAAPAFAKNKEKAHGQDAGKGKYQQPAAVHLDREGEKWAQKTLAKMSPEEKVGQMLMVWAQAEFLNVQSPEYRRLLDDIHKYHLGGFGLTVPEQAGLLVKSEPYAAAALINQLQQESDLPLLIAADFERGLAMRLTGVTAFPHAMAFGAAGNPEYAAEYGRIVAQEARAIGVVWNWFPVADVNSNPLNPVINTRAFSGDSRQTGELVAAYIRAARAGGLMTTAKHFPGHGDTDSDTHLGLARVDGDLHRLETVELPPFQAAIAAGVDAVMVGHITVPALDPDPTHVATNSPVIIHELLQKQLGFQGIVISDALDMNGYMRLYEKQAFSSQPSAVSQKAGDRSEDTGGGGEKTEDRRQEAGRGKPEGWSQETGVRRETAISRQQSAVSQKAGDRSEDTGGRSGRAAPQLMLVAQVQDEKTAISNQQSAVSQKAGDRSQETGVRRETAISRQQSAVSQKAGDRSEETGVGRKPVLSTQYSVGKEREAGGAGEKTENRSQETGDRRKPELSTQYSVADREESRSGPPQLMLVAQVQAQDEKTAVSNQQSAVSQQTGDRSQEKEVRKQEPGVTGGSAAAQNKDKKKADDKGTTSAQFPDASKTEFPAQKKTGDAGSAAQLPDASQVGFPEKKKTGAAGNNADFQDESKAGFPEKKSNKDDAGAGAHIPDANQVGFPEKKTKDAGNTAHIPDANHVGFPEKKNRDDAGAAGFPAAKTGDMPAAKEGTVKPSPGFQAPKPDLQEEKKKEVKPAMGPQSRKEAEEGVRRQETGDRSAFRNSDLGIGISNPASAAASPDATARLVPSSMNCHPEAAPFAAEGSMHSSTARKMHRSFAALRMTNQIPMHTGAAQRYDTFGQDDKVGGLALFSATANPKSQIQSFKSVGQFQNPKSYLASSPSARAAVAAVKAGNDIALLPSSIDGAYNGLLEAVRTGELREAQIDASVLKILRAKASVGLHRARLVDLEALPRLVHSPENQAVGQHVADAAVTLVREYSPTLASSSSSPKIGDDKGGAIQSPASPNHDGTTDWNWQLPRVPGFPCRTDPDTYSCIRPGTAEGPNAYTRVVETQNRIVAVVFTDDVRTEMGRGFEHELRARVPDANVMFIDESVAAFSADAVLATLATAERVIVAVYASPQPGKAVGHTTAGTSLRPKQAALLRTMLQRTGDQAVVVAMGNPYVAGDFPDVQTYLCTFSTTPVSEIAAVKALFGEIPIGGRLPVTIPGFAERGTGIIKLEQKAF